MRIPLPGDAWADVREVDDLKDRDRRAVVAAAQRAAKALVNPTNSEEAYALTDALLAQIVDAWSFDLPLPKDQADVVGELKIAQSDALYEHAGQIREALFPSPEIDPNPESPTEPSDD